MRRSRSAVLWDPLLLIGLALLLTTFSSGAFGQLTVSDDAYTSAAAPKKNFGGDVILAVQSASANSYVRFNLSPLPVGYNAANVKRGSVRLFVSAVTTPGSFDVVRVTGAWTETGISANAAPTLGAAIRTGIVLSATSKNSFISIDITPAALEWLSGTPNNGIALLPTAGSNISASFNSKEDTTTSHDPVLNLASDAAADLAVEKARTQSTEAAISTNLSGEIARAQAAEAGLGTGLSNESAARLQADATLQGDINTLGGSLANYARLDIGNRFNGNQNVAGQLAVQNDLGVLGNINLGPFNNTGSQLNVQNNSDRLAGYFVNANDLGSHNTIEAINTGFGTTLHVLQTNRSRAGFFELNNPGGTVALEASAVGSGVALKANNSGGGPSAIFPQGNVGIGTAAPQEKLEVVGNIRASGNIGAAAFTGDGSALTNVVAGTALNAQHANTADSAINAQHAVTADSAVTATDAIHAITADSAAVAANSSALAGLLPSAFAELGATTNEFSGTQFFSENSSNGFANLNVRMVDASAGAGTYAGIVVHTGGPQDAGGYLTAGATNSGDQYWFHQNALTLAAAGNTKLFLDAGAQDVNSIVIDTNGNVGVRNASPSQALDVAGTVKANMFVGDGSGLTNLPSANPLNVDAGNLTSGTVPDARLSSNVPLLSGGTLSIPGKFVGDGSALTFVSANSLTGTIAAARLPSNTAYSDVANSFTAPQYITAGLHVTGNPAAEALSVGTSSGSFGIFTAGDLSAIQATGGRSNSGAAGIFTNSAGGKILSGLSGSTEKFSVDGAGTVTAKKFVGDGSGLTNLPTQAPGTSFVNTKQIALLKWYPANQTIAFPVGSPARLLEAAYDGDNIWISDAGSNAVTKIRANDGKNLGSFSAGGIPDGLAFDGANIWVANRGASSVTKLRASDGNVLGTYSVGSNPLSIAFDGTNIWVTNSGSNSVSELRASDGALLAIYPVASPYGIAFDGANLWIASDAANTVTKLHASDGSNLGNFAVGTSPAGVAFDGSNVWVVNAGAASVSKVRTSDGNSLGTFSVGNSPWGVVFDGSSVWVTNRGGNSVTRLAASDGSNLGTFTVGGTPNGIAFDGVNIWVVNNGDGTVSKL